MEGFIYLGKYFDIKGREVSITDKKIGKSIDPLNREYQLNRTKGPIGYKIIVAYKVDDMDKVESMLHAILDSRRINGEWFKDEEDTLTADFINFMRVYGGEIYEPVNKQITNELEEIDNRLVNLSKSFGKETILIRNYLGIDYEILLNTKGLLVFNGQSFNTPNKLYNNGIVKFVKGKEGKSGTNTLTQFTIKENGNRLSEETFQTI